MDTIRTTFTIATALVLLGATVVAPTATAEEQHTNVEGHADANGATVTITTEGDLANENVTVTVPPGGGPSPPGIPSVPDPGPVCIPVNNQQICVF